MKSHYFLFFVLALIAGSASGSNHALIFGGGCEEVDSSNSASGEPCRGSDPTCTTDSTGTSRGHWNLFRPEFSNAHRALSLNGWQTTIQYDSNQWQRPWPGAQRSNLRNLRRQLRTYRTSLVSGDQLMINIATHGSGTPHEVCLGDGTMVSVSELATTIRTLRARGVRVAVMDSSCYSGATVDLLGDTGACLMSATNPYTTGGGDSVWAYTFGLGLPAGESIPSYYNASLPSGNADANGDHRISASEAFAFASVHSRDQGIGRTSECGMASGNLRTVLDSVAGILRSEYDADEETPWEDWTDDVGPSRRPSSGFACKLSSLPAPFSRLVRSMGVVQIEAFRTELEALGIPSPNSDVRLAHALLVAHSNLLIGRIAAAGAIQDQIDAHLSRREAVPEGLRSTLSDFEGQAGESKIAVLNALRPLIHVYCSGQRMRRSQPSECENFDLFPARPST